LAEPFLPFTAKKIKKMLRLSERNWQQVKGELLPAGQSIGKPELLFDKIEDNAVEQQVKKLLDTKITNAGEPKVDPAKPEIEFEDFSKLDIRTATIIEAKKMPKADKLLILKVNTGLDVRTVVSGIAQDYKPEELPGKKVLVLINLKPRKLRGVISEGMILMSQTTQGKLTFVNPEEDTDNGETVS
jgi:methionyl-tRNA synthetase